MKENGSLFTDGVIYNEFIEKLKQKSKEYSQNRKAGKDSLHEQMDCVDYAAYVDSLYTDYVNGRNDVQETDVLAAVEGFEENEGFSKNDIFEDFPKNVRKALEDFKNGNQ